MSQTLFPSNFGMAYQPILDLHKRTPVAFEALLRGPNGEGALNVLSWIKNEKRLAFDIACHIKAIETAAALQIPCNLHINLTVDTALQPSSCIQTILPVIDRTNLEREQMVFEIPDDRRMRNYERLNKIIDEYHEYGFRVAIDNLGVDEYDMNLLLETNPDMVKVDLSLIQDCNEYAKKRAIVASIIAIGKELDIDVVAEGIETPEELTILQQMNMPKGQGYLLGRPKFESLTPDEEIEPVFS